MLTQSRSRTHRVKLSDASVQSHRIGSKGKMLSDVGESLAVAAFGLRDFGDKPIKGEPLSGFDCRVDDRTKNLH
jgi:hypothetical protein